jgi:uncharacterized protein (DUF488 family)
VITTFGHSTLETSEALKILDAGGVDIVIDVRSHPTSRFVRWQRAEIAKWLPHYSSGLIQYQWWPELGGWDVRHAEDDGLRKAMADVGVDISAYSQGAFPKQRIAAQVMDDDPGIDPDQPTWTNRGLLDYAWFTSLGEFNVGLDRLVDMFDGPNKPTAALMCCEAVWWRCHRSMIADILTVRGAEVRHLPQWKDHLETDVHNRIGRYPAAVRASWSGVTPYLAQLIDGPTS